MRWKRWMVMAVVVILAVPAVPAKGAQSRGEILVKLDRKAGIGVGDTVLLYPVADSRGRDYALEEAYGGGLIRREDAMSDLLARWLAEAAVDGALESTVEQDGSAGFADLPEGLYLVKQGSAQQGTGPFEPILVPLPCNGAWQVAVFPQAGSVQTESPRTGQHPAPLIGAMGIVIFGFLLMLALDGIKRK